MERGLDPLNTNLVVADHADEKTSYKKIDTTRYNKQR